jgi:hypothetical protein
MAVAMIDLFATRTHVGNCQAGSFWLTGYEKLTKNMLRRFGISFAGVFAPPAAWTLSFKDASSAARYPNPFVAF